MEERALDSLLLRAQGKATPRARAVGCGVGRSPPSAQWRTTFSVREMALSGFGQPLTRGVPDAFTRSKGRSSRCLSWPMTARGSDSDGGNSIKGSVFALIVEDLLRLVSARKVARDELADRLEPSDVEFLDRPVWPTEWCDIRAYARFMELLVEIEGGGSHETCGNPAPPGRLDCYGRAVTSSSSI